MQRELPRILIGAFRGGSGKTLVSLGMLAAWRTQGRRVSVFKKGPDYIDAAWLSRASGQDCYNLDAYLMGDQGVVRSFRERTGEAEVAFVEGNRGLFDGMDAGGQHSSHALAQLLGLSVVLVVDCTKATRTMAALVRGCQELDPERCIRGVILNRVGTARQETVIRESMERYCGIPVLGAIPRVRDLKLNERHLGLYPIEEQGAVDETLQDIARLVTSSVDLDAVWKMLEQAASGTSMPTGSAAVEGRHHGAGPEPSDTPVSRPFSGVRMGVVRDSAFHFYYPENIEALRERGAEIVETHASRDTTLPEMDGLYIGGGFPETHAGQLAGNRSFKESLRRAVEKGMPVYAECGGAIYLGKGLEWQGQFYPFAGIFPVAYQFNRKPQGHGYTLLEVEGDNPFFQKGSRLKGHEFHYVGVRDLEEEVVRFSCRVLRGFGFDGHREGLCYKNTYATFSHLHALGESHWADRFMAQAAKRSVS